MIFNHNTAKIGNLFKWTGFAVLIALTGCSEPRPTLAELQAQCTNGSAEACDARDRIMAQPAAPLPQGTNVTVQGTGSRTNCQQGAEGEVTCTRF